MNEKYLHDMKSRIEFYPHKLQEQFPHLLQKIIQLWGSQTFDAHLNTLMLDKRDHHRQGFPPEVAREILRLSILHGELYKTVSTNSWIDSTDIWVS